MPTQQYLFNRAELGHHLRELQEKAAQQVEAIPRDQFLSTPDEDIVAHVVSRFTIAPLTIYEDRMTHKQHETKVDVGPRAAGFRGDPYYVHAVRVTVSLPFTGEPSLWHLCPGARILGMAPFGTVAAPDGQAATLDMDTDHPLHEPMDNLKRAVEDNLQLIRKYIGFQTGELARYNTELPQKVRERIKARRDRLTKHDEIAQLLAIPLARDPQAPTFKPLPIQKRIITTLPAPPHGGYKAEPGITDQHYEDILSVIRHVGRTFEATPRTYSVHGEEELRDIILAHLNGHYKGLATGETFRRTGKTDIRIEAECRAAFIAECKVWKGQKTIIESLDQLLGYLTWRDCKTAIVLFNKDVAGFSELLGKVQPAVEAHPRFMKTAHVSQGGEWRFVLRSKSDDARLVHVHVVLLNIHQD